MQVRRVSGAHSGVGHGRSDDLSSIVIIDRGGAIGAALALWLTGVGVPTRQITLDGLVGHRPIRGALIDGAIGAAAASQAVSRLREVHPDALAILLVDEARTDVTELAAQTGADGTLSSLLAPATLVRILSSGAPRVALQRESLTGVGRGRASDRADRGALRQLTPRELQVLKEVTAGATTERMSASLSISANTVRTHVQNILIKLDARSRLEVAAIGRRAGMLSTLEVVGDVG